MGYRSGLNSFFQNVQEIITDVNFLKHYIAASQTILKADQALTAGEFQLLTIKQIWPF